MMEQEWLEQQLNEWITTCPDYKERAFLVYSKQVLLEQLKRIQQQQGQLDGQLWSPKEW